MSSRRTQIVVAAIVVVGIVVGVVWQFGRNGDNDGLSTATSVQPIPGVVGAPQVTLDGGAAETGDDAVDIVLGLPNGAREMQISIDPTFAGSSWIPAATNSQIRLTDGGYQMVFARTRSSSALPTSPIGVSAITFDATAAAATASDDGSPHQVSWVGLVAPAILQVRIETGRVVLSASGPDRIVGRSINAELFDDPTRFVLDGVQPTNISRVSRPLGVAMIDGDRRAPMIHDVFLRFDQSLVAAAPHVLSFEGLDVDPYSFTIDPQRSPSSAVHINQVGFAPMDQGKVGLVSAWTGASGGIDYAELSAFRVVDTSDDQDVFTGTLAARSVGVRNEIGRGDLTGADVYEADFSALQTPGRYRLCVDQIGCSVPFVIDALATWQRDMVTVARAMYHQRSGIALGPPFTSIVRPRPFHPDDGVTFIQTSLTMVDDPADIGRDDRFDEYKTAATGDTVEGAWGGHFDAGDWNSRIQHLDYLRAALDLLRLYPDTYASLDLDIPESGDAMPDIVDEGLWDLDLYLRLQHVDGGVPGNVDQGRFSEGNETSWNNNITVYVFAPDVWSTYTYVGVAAYAAAVLAPYDAARAARYRDSALLGMQWAEAQWATDPLRPQLSESVDPIRATAAAALLLLTNDAEWNDVFADASNFDQGPMDLLDVAGPVANSAWMYSMIEPTVTDPGTAANVRESFVRNAEAALVAQNTTAFAWTMERPDIPIVYGLGPSVPHGVGLLRAYVLTGDVRYRTAMVRAASFSLGGNPLNTSFITGLGAHPARHPLIVDSLNSGLPVWAGTPEYGIHDLKFSDTDDWVEQYFLEPWGTTPAASSVPLLWSWYDASPFPMMNEFTVTQTHSAALWTFGVLAAT